MLDKPLLPIDKSREQELFYVKERTGEKVPHPKSGFLCPIDNNPLISVEGFNGRYYQYYALKCCACGAKYATNNTEPDNLRKQAIWYLEKLESEAAQKREDITEIQTELQPLEIILEAGKKNGLRPE